MPPRALAPVLALWSSAYVGCALFLLAGLLPGGPLSIALLGQLCWLALIGSIPTTLVLGAASRVAKAEPAVIGAATVAVLILAIAVGWGHTDFLLAGPRWVMDPQRRELRVAVISLLGSCAAAGWLWLIVGIRIDDGRRLAAWIVCSALAITLLSIGIARYRAHDYSVAQLVFPAGILSGATVYLLFRGSARGPVALGIAALFLFCAVGSRIVPDLAATGHREVIVHSRAGALATLYVLPHFGTEEAWSATGEACPEPRPVIEESPIGIEPEGRRSVIIVTVDALRADVVGASVNGRPVTPELSRLAAAGVSFQNATSTYPATLFAVGSAFTGMSPTELYLSPALPDTLFTRSRAHVDRQIAVLPDVGWFRLPIVERFLAPGVETRFARTDAAATDALIEHLRVARSDDASVMAWIHYYSPHDPYQPQPAFPFGKGKKNAYLSEVATFDRELGRLMRHLKDHGWLEDSLVVFFSDHGEALGEKSYWGHHVYLNGWMIDVPLVLWHASLPPARPRVGVSVSDVAPTVLHFLGLPLPSGMTAQSLFTLDPDLPNRPSFSEAFPVRGRELFDSFRLPALDEATIRQRLRSIRVANKGYEPKGAITRDRYRLIHHRGADTMLLYDREAGSGEELVRGTAGREAGKLLQSELERWEQEQLGRIRCRLQLSAEQPRTPRLE